jgi:hypothetical protein
MSPTGLRGRAPETSRAVAYGPSFKKLDRERSDRALYPSPAKRRGGKAEAKRRARVGGCLDTPNLTLISFASSLPATRSHSWGRDNACVSHDHNFGFSELALDGGVDAALLSRTVPPRQEGRLAIVTNAGRDAMDAAAQPDERRLCPAEPFGEDGWPWTAKSCGSDAPTLASSLRRQSRKRWWQKSPAHQEEHEGNR